MSKLLKDFEFAKQALLKRSCWNCGQELELGDNGHYVPPAFGEEGYYACDYVPKEALNP